jgi:multiple antibiotic resistance protein
LLETASLAFVALLVTIDPIGLVPIFLALTPLEAAASRRLTALKGVAIGGCILLVFALMGEPGLRTLAPPPLLRSFCR